MSGKIVTEGDRVLKADTACNKFKVDGNGVKIGIIASSFNAKYPSNSDVFNAELPGVNNPQEIQINSTIERSQIRESAR
jgi:hypothetical protein